MRLTTRPTWLVLTALVVMLAALAHVPPAHAQSERAEAQARRLFDAGVELVREGRPDAAVPLFRESLERSVRPTTAFNLAIALRDAGEPREAMAVLQGLRDGAYGELDVEQRSAVERQQERLAEHLAALEVELRAAARASLYVDGEAAGEIEPGTPRAEWLDPGPHRIGAVIAGGASVEEHVELAPGVRTRLVLRVEEIPAAAPPVEIPTEPASSSDDGVWIAVGVATGVALLVAGAIVAGVLVSESQSGQGPTVDPVYGHTETLVIRF